jgi:carboxyl-terminal processing protease
MPRKKLRPWVPATLAVAIAVAFLTGAAVDRVFLVQRDPPDPPAAATPGSSPSAVQSPSFSLIQQAWDVINREYVDRAALQSEPLTDGAISGMVDALGDTGHSTFLTPKMVEEERSLMRGEYVGVGLEIEEKNGRIVIVAPLDNSPAIAAGLHAGEQILKVNNQGIADQSLTEVVGRIVGPAGSTVVLSVFDPASRATTDVTLKRAEIHVDNVSWQPIPGSPFADLRIAGFSAGVTKEVRAALQAIQDAKLKGVVLDMRNNPGGELGEAIGVASQFLPSGDVVLEKDAKGGITHDAVRRGAVAPTVPLVVLINGGTASGAEIVAGAIQDARRGPLIGETTYGTGTVLENFPLSDGSSVLLAVREWLTPAGRTIWHKGIVPDTPLALPLDSEIVTPASLKGMSKAELDSSTDVQLKKALEMLAR